MTDIKVTKNAVQNTNKRLICLQSGHTTSNFRSKFFCYCCHQQSNSSLGDNRAHPDFKPENSNRVTSPADSNCTSLPVNALNSVLMPTATTGVGDLTKTRTKIARLLFHTALQMSYISHELAAKLHLQPIERKIICLMSKITHLHECSD